MANEKRLIDANALLKELDKFINPMPDANGLHFMSGLCTGITEIETAPTVDAVEVVHGRWIELYMGELKCPICDEKVMCVGWLTNGKYNYCPNCGAKMDGGNEDV